MGVADGYSQRLDAKIEEWEIAGIDRELLLTALMHPSYDGEGKRNNQRLEFLGDAVLGVVIADYLYDEYPAYHEGELTRTRALLAKEATLAAVARKIGLPQVVLLGRGEEKDGGRDRASTLADAMEALIAAIYLHFGFERAAEFVRRHFAALEKGENEESVVDHKTLLQEYVQSRGADNVSYRTLAEEGPPHRRIFTSGVYYKKQLLARGYGKTKKEAEKDAARAGYLQLTGGQDGDHGAR